MCLVGEIRLSRIFSLWHSYCSQLLFRFTVKEKKRTVKHEKHTVGQGQQRCELKSHRSNSRNSEEISCHYTLTMVNFIPKL